jgi:hypothetical protein
VPPTGPVLRVTSATPLAGVPDSREAHAVIHPTTHLFRGGAVGTDGWPLDDDGAAFTWEDGFAPQDGWYKLVATHRAPHYGVAYDPPCVAEDPRGWGEFDWDVGATFPHLADGFARMALTGAAYKRDAGLTFASRQRVASFVRGAVDSVALDEDAIERAVQWGLLVVPVAVPRGARVGVDAASHCARSETLVLGPPTTLAHFMARQTTLRDAVARAEASIAEFWEPLPLDDVLFVAARAAWERLGAATLDAPLGDLSPDDWTRVAETAVAMQSLASDDAKAHRAARALPRKLFHALTTHELQRLAIAPDAALLPWLRVLGASLLRLRNDSLGSWRAVHGDVWAALLLDDDDMANVADVLSTLAAARPHDVTPSLVERLVAKYGLDGVLRGLASVAGAQPSALDDARVPTHLRRIYCNLRARGGADPPWLVQLRTYSSACIRTATVRAAVEREIKAEAERLRLARHEAELAVA